MKDTIKNIIDSDPTPNKSSTRYIYKNYPTIWKNILEKTLLPYQFDAINLVERGLTKIVISKDTVAGKPATMFFNKNTAA